MKRILLLACCLLAISAPATYAQQNQSQTQQRSEDPKVAIKKAAKNLDEKLAAGNETDAQLELRRALNGIQDYMNTMNTKANSAQGKEKERYSTIVNKKQKQYHEIKKMSGSLTANRSKLKASFEEVMSDM